MTYGLFRFQLNRLCSLCNVKYCILQYVGTRMPNVINVLARIHLAREFIANSL